jgi:hypothetical protein
MGMVQTNTKIKENIFNSPDKIIFPLNCSIEYDSFDMELEKEISFEKHIDNDKTF